MVGGGGEETAATVLRKRGASFHGKGRRIVLHAYLFIALLFLSPSLLPWAEATTRNLPSSDRSVPSHYSGRRQLIYNGWQTTTEDYPFGAALVQDSLEHVCSGSLITPGVVLTAAHCFSDNAYVYDYNNDFTHRRHEEIKFTSSYRVVLGRDLSGDHAPSEAIGISKVVIGEPFDFSTGSASWDLALVFLDTCQVDYKPIKILRGNIWNSLRQSLQEENQQQQQHVEINTEEASSSIAESLIQKPVSVVGWGDTEGQCVKLQREEDEVDEMMEMLYQVESCEQDSFCEEDGHQQVLCDTATTMCMQKKNVASCDGDSGAPIFVRVSNRAVALAGGSTSTTTTVDEDDRSSEEEMPYQYVQVGVLSGGQVVFENELDVRNSMHRMKQGGDLAFVDHARGALLTGYTSWLQEHLETDACLGESNMTASDVFVAHY